MLGMRSGTRDEWQRSLGCRWGSSPDVILRNIICVPFVADRPIYLSVDIDVLDPWAPARHGHARGAPGISSRELFSFLYSLADLNVVAMDVNEILPGGGNRPESRPSPARS